MRPSAVAFDFDDTLLDWPATLRACLDRMASPAVADAYLALAPTTWRSEGDVVIHRNTWRLGEEAEEYWAQLGLAHLSEPFRAALDLVPVDGAMAVVRAIRARVPVALCTNNPHVGRDLHRLGWTAEFDHVVVAADPPKPHPDAFAALCRTLALPAPAVAFVGDSAHSDIRGAHGAGLRAVWFDRYGDAWDPPAGVQRITTLADLLDLLG